jgi:hypothetical protein
MSEEVQRPDETRARQRRKSVVLALILGFLVLLFYIVTIAKLGPNVLSRPL